MEDKTIIIGHVGTGKSVHHLMPEHSILVVDTEKEQLPFPKDEPYIINNPYSRILDDIPFLRGINEGKQFICKGKHQYREVTEELNDGISKRNWVCQCGRNLNN